MGTNYISNWTLDNGQFNYNVKSKVKVVPMETDTVN